MRYSFIGAKHGSTGFNFFFTRSGVNSSLLSRKWRIASFCVIISGSAYAAP